ncbi:MAG: TIGR03000 domain-containing protein [Planctomycetota bacterium]|nr:MAG: TIGR03000 domain-containing protein [Planctomycetota bacterium]
MRSLMRRAAVVGLVAAAGLMTEQSHAQWYGSSGGSSGSYAVAYGSSGGSSGYSYGSYGSSGYVAAYGSSGGSSGYVGPIRRLAWRIHDSIHAHIEYKRARRAARRAAYGSSGYYYGSSGGSSGTVSYSSCGSSGYSVSYGSSGGSVSYGSVGSAYSSASSAVAPRTTARLASDATVSQGELHLTVTVPPQAKVYVNDRPTTSTGRVRHFVSRGLEPGQTYRFQIRAELQAADGQTLVENREVVVTGGGEEALEFAFADQNSPVETAVTLHVPDNAQVILAGNPTSADGPVRTFRTLRLRPGDVWDDYEVEVRLGQRVKRQTLRLMAGDQLELSFDFDEDSVDMIAAR